MWIYSCIFSVWTDVLCLFPPPPSASLGGRNHLFSRRPLGRPLRSLNAPPFGGERSVVSARRFALTDFLRKDLKVDLSLCWEEQVRVHLQEDINDDACDGNNNDDHPVQSPCVQDVQCRVDEWREGRWTGPSQEHVDINGK